jgi:hypothetical protein
MTFLCISCYHKGAPFLKAAKAAGNDIILLTMKRLEHVGWPSEAIDEMMFME